MKNPIVLVIALALLGAAGCKTRHLVFTTYTKVGLDISTTDGEMANAVFGYKRFEGAVIPVKPKSAAGGAEDTKSVFAGITTCNSWLRGLKLKQVFATGDAAVDLASSNTEYLGKLLSLAEGSGFCARSGSSGSGDDGHGDNEEGSE